MSHKTGTIQNHIEINEKIERSKTDFVMKKNEIRYEKINPRNKKVVLVIRGKCSICGRNKSRIYSYK